MKILSIGLDDSFLDNKSALYRRLSLFEGVVDKYTVFSPAHKTETIKISGTAAGFGVGGANKIIKFLRLAKKVISEVKNDHYDLITVQDTYYLALLSLFIARIFGLPLEVQVHGFEKEYTWRKLIARYVLNEAQSIRVVSQRLKDELKDEFLLPDEKINILPIFIDQSGIIAKDDYRSGIPFVFVWVGRLVEVKNAELAIKAIKLLKDESFKVVLNIVGSGPCQNKLENLVKDLDVVDQVNFVGQVFNVGSYYQNADTFLLTSNREGWGMAVVEAASYGLPIIMTDVGLAGDVVKDNISGLIVPVGDTKALMTAMKKVIIDVDLREKLGRAAKIAVDILPNQEKAHLYYKKNWVEVISRRPLKSAGWELFWKLGRFVTSGGSAAIVHLFILWLLTEVAGIWYLLSSVVGFFVAFSVSFTLQKYWTFKEVSFNRIKIQTGFYLVIALFNLFLNTAMMYWLVDFLDIHYLLAQIIVGLLIAIWSYLAYSRFIFHRL